MDQGRIHFIADLDKGVDPGLGGCVLLSHTALLPFLYRILIKIELKKEKKQNYKVPFI